MTPNRRFCPLDRPDYVTNAERLRALDEPPTFGALVVRVLVFVGLIVACLFMFSGCYEMPRPMTNAEIIAAIQECDKSGLKATILKDWNGMVRVIQCEPKDPA